MSEVTALPTEPQPLPFSSCCTSHAHPHFLHFFKNGPTPASFSFIFGLFKPKSLQFLQKMNVKKCHVNPVHGTGIQTHNLSSTSRAPHPFSSFVCSRLSRGAFHFTIWEEVPLVELRLMSFRLDNETNWKEKRETNS